MAGVFLKFMAICYSDNALHSTPAVNELSISEYIDFAVILKLQSRLECVEEK